MLVAEIFVDTAGWASAFVRSEPFHAKAASLLRQWQAGGSRVVTTNYVLAELAALLTSPLRVPRPQQAAILERIRLAPWVEVIHIDEALDASAFQLFKDRPDKLWSLVDCASFVVMQQQGVSDALTTDQHFEQAGFVRLLK